MSPEFHKAKAERIARSMQKLNHVDFEAVIEACMLAGSHWLNFACHRMELTASSSDIMHAEYLSGVHRIELTLQAPELLQAMDEIESYRAIFVRGDLDGGVQAGIRCRGLLELIQHEAMAAKPLKRDRTA